MTDVRKILNQIIKELDAAEANTARLRHAYRALSGGMIPNSKRQLSSAARKRIAQAQKKRWAKFHAKRKG